MYWMLEAAIAVGMNETDLGRELKRLRLAAGLTQAKLADRLRVTQTYVSKVETGTILRPPPDAVAEWADACGFRLVFRFQPATTNTTIDELDEALSSANPADIEAAGALIAGLTSLLKRK